MTDASLRVLIAEDEPKLLFAVQTLLELDPSLEVVSVVSSAEGAIDAVGELRPDVVLLDVRLGASDGVDAAQAIRATFPHVGIVIYSGDEGDLARATALGFQHVLLKGAIAEDLVVAISAAGRAASP